MSIHSHDDMELPSGKKLALDHESRTQVDPQSPGYSESQSNTDDGHVGPQDLKQALPSPSISPDRLSAGAGAGYRAAEAYIRPSPIKTNSQLLSHLFDLRNCTFTMSLTAEAASPQETPTEIYLPEFHFPEGQSVVSVSSGEYKIEFEEINSVKVQRIRWWHSEGEQDIKVEGVKRKLGELYNGTAEDVGYIEQCQQRGCIVM